MDLMKYVYRFYSTPDSEPAAMQRPLVLLAFLFSFVHASSHNRIMKARATTTTFDMNEEHSLWQKHSGIVDSVKSAMLASIRTRFAFLILSTREARILHNLVGSRAQPQMGFLRLIMTITPSSLVLLSHPMDKPRPLYNSPYRPLSDKPQMVVSVKISTTQRTARRSMALLRVLPYSWERLFLIQRGRATGKMLQIKS